MAGGGGNQASNRWLVYFSNTDLKLLLILLCLFFPNARNPVTLGQSWFRILKSISLQYCCRWKFWISFSWNHALQILGIVPTTWSSLRRLALICGGDLLWPDSAVNTPVRPMWRCLHVSMAKRNSYHSNYFRVSLLCQTASAYCNVVHQFIKSGALVFFHFKIR